MFVDSHTTTIFPTGFSQFKYLYISIFLCLATACNQNSTPSENTEISYDVINNAFQSRKGPLLFNHLYVTLDSLTFSRVKNSAFLSTTYANIDQGLPDFNPVKKESSSFYLRGEEHYIEILGPGNKFGEPAGRSGIGFQIETAEEFKLRETPPLSQPNKTFLTGTDTVSYSLKGEPIVWYQPFYTTGSILTEVYTWYALYNPEFLNKLHNKNVENYTAGNFLEPIYNEEKRFNSITRLEIVCNEADFKRIAMEMQLFNHRWTKDNKELRVKLRDLDLVIIFNPSREESYIKKIHLHLNQEDYSSLDLGRLKIVNTGKLSTWEFFNN